MEDLRETLSGIDIYLLDQFMKGRINRYTSILDAGCGKGRNSLALERFGCNNITAIDEDIEAFENINAKSKSIRILHSKIEDFMPKSPFDFIICSAVLHFAQNHAHFNAMISALANCMNKDSVLFIRMTSDFANRNSFMPDELGVARLGDGTDRYLLDEMRLEDLKQVHGLKLIEPLKTVNVDNMRCMSTLVLRKS